MKKGKELKVGDEIIIDEKDMTIFVGYFDETDALESLVERLAERIYAKKKRAWKVMAKRIPEFLTYRLEFNRETKRLIILGKN